MARLRDSGVAVGLLDVRAGAGRRRSCGRWSVDQGGRPAVLGGPVDLEPAGDQRRAGAGSGVPPRAHGDRQGGAGQRPVGHRAAARRCVAVAERTGAAPDAVALAAAAAQPWADRVLLGAAGVEQLDAEPAAPTRARAGRRGSRGADRSRRGPGEYWARRSALPWRVSRGPISRSDPLADVRPVDIAARPRPARPGSGRSPPPARPGTPRGPGSPPACRPRSALISAIFAAGHVDGPPRGAADHHRLGVLLGAQQGVRERLDGVGRSRSSIADAIGIGGCEPSRVGSLVAMSRSVLASVRTCTSTICRVSLVCCSRSSELVQDDRPGCICSDWLGPFDIGLGRRGESALLARGPQPAGGVLDRPGSADPVGHRSPARRRGRRPARPPTGSRRRRSSAARRRSSRPPRPPAPISVSRNRLPACRRCPAPARTGR